MMLVVHTTDHLDFDEPSGLREERFSLGPMPPAEFPEPSDDFFYSGEFSDAFLGEEGTRGAFGWLELSVEVARVFTNEREARDVFGEGSALSNEEAAARLSQLVRMHRQGGRRLLKRNHAYLLLTPSHTLWFWDAIDVGGKLQLCAFVRCDLRRVYPGTRILIPDRR